MIRALADGEDAFRSALENCPDFDAMAFLAFAERHRVAPWLTQALDHPQAAEFLPSVVRTRLAEERSIQQRRVDALLRQCAELRSALAEAGVDFLFLKGLYFGERLYGDPGLRPQWDVDVLVHPDRLEDGLRVLGRLGYDVRTNAENRRPVVERLRDIRRRPREARHGITVRRREDTVDVHWILRRRLFDRIDHDRFWEARQTFVVRDQTFETLSDEDALMFLLVSICSDVKRGGCRARQLLDLYLMLRLLTNRLNWEAFLEQRRQQGLLPLSVNVLAIFFHAWECAPEFPQLACAVEKRRRLLALRGCEEALSLLTRPRGTPENRTWFRRVYPRSRLRRLGWALTVDLAHNVTRLFAPPPGFVSPQGCATLRTRREGR